MAEDTNAAAGAAGGDAGATAAAVDDKKVADTGGANLGSDDAGTVGDGAGSHDWRARYGEDPELQKILARLPSEAELAKKLVSQEKLIRSGQHKTVAPLAEDATPEEVAAYRKAAGIPEKADGYGLAFPEEWKPSEGDKAGLAAFQEYALAKHMTPAAAKTAFEFYAQHMAAGQAAREEAVQEAKLQNLAELRGEWKGGEYKHQIGLVRDFFGKGFEGHEAALDLLSNATLPNGMRVGDSAEILRAMAAFAGKHADDGALIGGDGAGGGKSLDDEYKDLINKSATPGQKLSATEEKRLMQIAEARASREAKQGRARAA